MNAADPSAGPRPLTAGIQFLPGVGPKRAELLAQLGITNLGRLIAHLPHRYEHERAESAIAQLETGVLASARGHITATRVAGRGSKRRFEAVLIDDTGRLDLVWFNQQFLTHTILPGTRLWVQGKPARRGGMVQMAHPLFEILDEHEPAQRRERLRPIYPATEGLTSRQIENIIDVALDDAVSQIEDHFTPAFGRQRELPLLADAYRMMHRPQSEQDIAEARRRLAYDELFMLQLAVHLKKQHLRTTLRAPALSITLAIDQHIRQRLRLSLTPGQERVVAELRADLARTAPTNRLIQGDVGSGKTFVAIYAMLAAVAAGHQAALMAPTELLAEQHHASITAMLEGSRVRCALLTGSIAPAERTALLDRLARGQIDLLIGTHALLTDTVAFASLAVAVIDEQHRFGVHQRAALRAKGEDAASSPHVLVMTATPIPRTVAMTLFGDLDLSIIDDLPPGRQPITTRHLRTAERADAEAILAEHIARGEQGYVVVPSIEGEHAAGVDDVARRLAAGPLAGRRIATLHGRMNRAQRDAVMSRFRAGAIDVLVATTVIEVGVDVSNATIIVIEDADRFGLAQLHQLRGRVGRGDKPATCLLIADPSTPDALARLEAICSTADGFVLAERDFQIRGPGELIGARQSGDMPLQVADLATDLELLAQAQRDARDWVAASPTLARDTDALLRKRLVKKYGLGLGLADVG